MRCCCSLWCRQLLWRLGELLLAVLLTSVCWISLLAPFGTDEPSTKLAAAVCRTVRPYSPLTNALSTVPNGRNVDCAWLMAQVQTQRTNESIVCGIGSKAQNRPLFNSMLPAGWFAAAAAMTTA